MREQPIYLDYMSTTPVDPRVIAEMIRYLGPNDVFANPASIQHLPGQQAAQAIESARHQIAESINAHAEDIIFTSGATEANNLAILGAARFYQRKGRHLITMTTEHKAVLDCFRQLELEGFEVSYLDPISSGLLDLDQLRAVIRPDTILVSMMHVNNEIGVIQDIASIGRILQSEGIIFHVDAAQSAGRLPIDLSNLPVHLMSFSAHKNYGPKGIGALFVRQQPRIRLQPQSYGGGQERGLRAGTLPTHQIVGMGAAFTLSESLRIEEQQNILSLRAFLWDKLQTIAGLSLNGCLEHRIAGNLNFSIEGIDGATLLPALHQLAVSSSSACTASSTQPSYVLRALGLDPNLAKSSIRLSIGRFTTREDIEKTGEILCQIIQQLRKNGNAAYLTSLNQT